MKKEIIIEILPEIKINIRVKPLEFLSEMMTIAEESGSYSTEILSDGFSLDVYSFTPKYDCHINELFGQLIYEYQSENKIRVEMRAPIWNSEHPTKKEYIESAHLVFDQLLKNYNKKYGTRCRLVVIIHKPFKLPPKANSAFKKFKSVANQKSLHPLDWDNLYFFIRTCKATRVRFSKEEMWGLLSSAGFEKDKAEEIAEIAYHLFQYAKKY